MTDTAIHTAKLSRSFDSVCAVDSLDIDIRKGSVFGFLGPNGAGKTTTIRLLLGLLAPDEGSAEILGFDTVRENHLIRENTGTLLEHTGLYERLSVEDNLDLFGRIYKMPEHARKTRINDLLEQFGLSDRRKTRTGSLSRGMKQKLAVARTLLHNPPLIFLDEPTAGLDPVAAAQLRDNLTSLVKSEGITVFLTTHNLAEAERLCDSVGVIRNGRLLAVGPPSELMGSSENSTVKVTGAGFTEPLTQKLKALTGVLNVDLHTGDSMTVTLASGTNMAEAVRLIVESGADIEEVKKESASLEETFMTLLDEKAEGTPDAD